MLVKTKKYCKLIYAVAFLVFLPSNFFLFLCWLQYSREPTISWANHTVHTRTVIDHCHCHCARTTDGRSDLHSQLFRVANAAAKMD